MTNEIETKLNALASSLMGVEDTKPKGQPAPRSFVLVRCKLADGTTDCDIYEGDARIASNVDPKVAGVLAAALDLHAALEAMVASPTDEARNKALLALGRVRLAQQR